MILALPTISIRLVLMDCRGVEMTENASRWGMTENVLKVLTANLTNTATWENAQTSRR
jgi:hypothetical protein